MRKFNSHEENLYCKNRMPYSFLYSSVFLLLLLKFQMADNDMIEPFRKHGTSYKSFILIFFLGSFGIAISFAVLSLPPTAEFTQFRNFLILFSRILGAATR